MAQSKVRTVSTFRAPSAYEEEMMRAQRQQQLAEMLRQQAFTPDEEPYTFQGFRATPSPANAIARVLSAYTSKKLGEKAEKAESKARQADLEAFETLRRDLGPQTRTVAPDMFGDPMEMGSKYTPPVTETVMPTYQQREETLTRALAGGTPMAQRYAQLMLSREPQVTLEALMEASEPSRKAYFESRDPTVLAKPTKAPESTTTQRDYEFARSQGYQGSFEDFRRAATPSTVVNLDTKGSQLGQELYLKKIDSLEAPARNAGRILNQVNAMDKATQGGTFKGSMAPTAVGAAQFLESFGIKVKPDVLANTRAFQAASNQLVLDFMAANGGARGFTEKETAILQDAFPKIIDSPDARRQIADLLRNRALQDVEDYNFAVGEFGKTFPNVVTPYKPIDNEEIRYQRWRRSQGGG